MITMRAKFEVRSVTQYHKDGDVGQPIVQETIHFSAVTAKPYDKDGLNEDNTFAQFTPMAELSMQIRNPALLGQYKQGMKFYADFTVAAE